jgi:hypothetical protein
LSPENSSYALTSLYLLFSFFSFSLSVMDTLLEFESYFHWCCLLVFRMARTINTWRVCSDTLLFEMVGFLYTCYKIKFCVAIFSRNYSWGTNDGSFSVFTCADPSKKRRTSRKNKVIPLSLSPEHN